MDHYNLSLVSDSSLEAVVSLFKTRAFQCWTYFFLMYWNYVKYVEGSVVNFSWRFDLSASMMTRDLSGFVRSLLVVVC